MFEVYEKVSEVFDLVVSYLILLIDHIFNLRKPIVYCWVLYRYIENMSSKNFMFILIL